MAYKSKWGHTFLCSCSTGEKDHLPPTVPQKPFPSGWLRGQLRSHVPLLCQLTLPKGAAPWMAEAWVPKPFNGKAVGLPRVVPSKQDTSQSWEWGSVPLSTGPPEEKVDTWIKIRALSGKGMGSIDVVKWIPTPCESRVLAQPDLLQIGHFFVYLLPF